MCSAVQIDKKELFRDRQLTPYTQDIIPGYSGFLCYHDHAIYLVDNAARSSQQIEPNIHGLMLCEEELFAGFYLVCTNARSQGLHPYDIDDLYAKTKIIPICFDIVAEAILYAIEKLNPTFDGLQMSLETYLETSFYFTHSQALHTFRKLSTTSPAVRILEAFIQTNNLGSSEMILSMAKDRVSAIYKNAISGLNVHSKMLFGICLVNPTVTWLCPTSWTEALSMFQNAIEEKDTLDYPFVDFLKGFLAATTWQHLPDIYADCLLPDFSSDVHISFEEKEAFFRAYISLREKPVRKELNEQPDRSEPVSDLDCYQIVFDNELSQYQDSMAAQASEDIQYLEPYCKSFFNYFKKQYKVKGAQVPDVNRIPSFIVNSTKSDTILNLLRTYMSGKSKPKQIMMAVRAAMDAGVITKPTQSEFKKVFPDFCPSNKDSFNAPIQQDLVGPQHPYVKVVAFAEMVQSFKDL